MQLLLSVGRCWLCTVTVTLLSMLCAHCSLLNTTTSSSAHCDCGGARAGGLVSGSDKPRVPVLVTGTGRQAALVPLVT